MAITEPTVQVPASDMVELHTAYKYYVTNTVHDQGHLSDEQVEAVYKKYDYYYERACKKLRKFRRETKDY